MANEEWAKRFLRLAGYSPKDTREPRGPERMAKMKAARGPYSDPRDTHIARTIRWAFCTAKDVPGAKLVLYDDTTRQIFVLDPQEPAAGHLGDSVTVSGTVEGDTLHVVSVKTLTDIGLAVGQKAPTFTARDQFGQEQSLATLKGRSGTVLLFFRSADW